MAANIDSYVGRQAAWHELGTVTGHYMTWAEVEAANDGALAYTVFKSQLHDGLGRPIDAYGTFRWNAADRLAGRKDACVFLGTVGKDYEVIQHGQGFQGSDALVASINGAHYETAGSLGKGERVWGLADLNFGVSVGDDKQKGYLLFCTGHDGSLSHQYRMVLTRVVCQNTLSAALSEKTRGSMLIRHTKNAQTRLADMDATLAGLRGDMLTVEQKLNFLAGRRVTRETLTAIMDRLYPKPKVVDGAEPKDSSSRRDNVLAAVLACYESNDNNAFPEQRGTAYNLLNAVTEHTDHMRTSRGDNRPESAMFGTGDKLKSQALEVIMQTADGMPTVQTVTYVPQIATPARAMAVLPKRQFGGVLDDILNAHS